jgi:hypothetical protein
MKNSVYTLAAITVLSMSTLTVSAQMQAAPQAMGGSAPRPQAMGGSAPRPQGATGVGGVVTAILTFFGF